MLKPPDPGITSRAGVGMIRCAIFTCPTQQMTCGRDKFLHQAGDQLLNQSNGDYTWILTGADGIVDADALIKFC